MKKSILITAMVMLMCCFATVPAAAANIQPRWLNVKSITLTMKFSSNKANVTGLVEGQSDTKKISATFYLQEKDGSNWKTIHTWPAVSVDGDTLTFSDSTSATTGKTYRFCVTATVTNKAGVSETVSDYYEKKY